MTTEIKVSISTGLNDILVLSNRLSVTVDMITLYFDKIIAWCMLNLESDTWRFSELITVNDWKNESMIFAHNITFDNDSDATAFALIFKHPEKACIL